MFELNLLEDIRVNFKRNKKKKEGFRGNLRIFILLSEVVVRKIGLKSTCIDSAGSLTLKFLYFSILGFTSFKDQK